MSLFNFNDLEENPTDPNAKEPTQMQITAPAYDSGTVELNLLTDLEGEPWAVEYYTQILGSGESTKILDISLDPTLQQYMRVIGFQISVTEELSTQQEQDSGVMVITGGGLFYPDTIIPHVGDMFVGRIERGRLAVWTVTTVERMSFYERGVYQVTFRFYSENDTEVRANLNAKAVVSKYFDKQRLSAGRAPIVSYATANREINYKSVLTRNIDLLYNKFYDEVLGSFIFDTTFGNCYDPFAVCFFNTTLPRSFRGLKASPTEYSVGNIVSPLLKPTIWRMLVSSDGQGANYIYPRDFELIRVGTLTTHTVQNSIVHTSINFVPLPRKWNTVDINLANPAYVLSHNFYDKTTNLLTNLERAVWTVLDRERIKDADLDVLIDELAGLTDRELFYQILLVNFILTIRLNEG